MITALQTTATATAAAPIRRPVRHCAARRSHGRPVAGAPRFKREAGPSNRGVEVISAMSMSVDAEVRGMARPQVPNYLLRRLVVGAVAATVAFCALVAVVGTAPALLGGPAVAAASTGPDAAAPDAAGSSTMGAVHVARSGETLWSIADEYRGDIGRDDFIDALVGLNGGRASIQAGQAVRLP